MPCFASSSITGVFAFLNWSRLQPSITIMYARFAGFFGFVFDSFTEGSFAESIFLKNCL